MEDSSHEQPLSPVLNKKRFSRRQHASQKQIQNPESPRYVEKRLSSIPIPIGQKSKSPPKRTAASDDKNASPRRDAVVLHGCSRPPNEPKVKERSCFIIGEEMNVVCDDEDYLLVPRCTKTCSSDSMESPRNRVELFRNAQCVGHKSQLNYNIGTDESNFTLDNPDYKFAKSNRKKCSVPNVSKHKDDAAFLNTFEGGNSKDVINVNISDSVFNTEGEEFFGFTERDVIERFYETENCQRFLEMFKNGLTNSNLRKFESVPSLADSPSVKKLRTCSLNDEACELFGKELEEKKSSGGVKRTRRDSWDDGEVKMKGVGEDSQMRYSWDDEDRKDKETSFIDMAKAINDMKTRMNIELSDDGEDAKKISKVVNSEIVVERCCTKNSSRSNKIISQTVIENTNSINVVERNLNTSKEDNKQCSERQTIKDENLPCTPEKLTTLKSPEDNSCDRLKNKERRTRSRKHSTDVALGKTTMSEQQIIDAEHKKSPSRRNKSPPRENEKKHSSESPKKSSDSSKRGKSSRKIPKNKDSKTSSDSSKLKNAEISSPVKTENPNLITLPSSNGVQICIGNNRIKINIRTTEGERKIEDSGYLNSSKNTELGIKSTCGNEIQSIELNPAKNNEMNCIDAANSSGIKALVVDERKMGDSSKMSEFLNDSFTIPSQFLDDEKFEELLIKKSSPVSIDKEPDKEDDVSSKNAELTSFGFAAASGKKIVVSEERMKCAIKFFEDENKIDDNFNVNNNARDSEFKLKIPPSIENCNMNNEHTIVDGGNNKRVEKEFDFTFKIPSTISDYNKSKTEMSKLTPEKSSNVQQSNHGMNGDLKDFGGSSPPHRKPLKPKSLLKPRPELGRPSYMQSGSRKSLKFLMDNPSCSGDAGLNAMETAKLNTGFALASGKPVETAKERLKAAMNIFNGIEKDVSALIDAANGKENNAMNENQLNEEKNRSPFNVVRGNHNCVNSFDQPSTSSTFSGNRVGSNGNQLGINENPSRLVENELATKQNNRSLNENQLINQQNKRSLSTDSQSSFTQNQSNPAGPSTTRFSLPSGKAIGISEAQLHRAKMLFGDDLYLKDDLSFGSLKMKKLSQSSKAEHGFSIAKPFKPVGNDEAFSFSSEISKDEKQEDNNNGRATSENANNKPIGFSSAAAVKAQEDGVSCKIFGAPIGENRAFGFSLATRKKAASSKDRLKKATRVFGDDLQPHNETAKENKRKFDEVKTHVQNPKIDNSTANQSGGKAEMVERIISTDRVKSGFGGFSTASGQNAISKDRWENAVKFFGDDLNLGETDFRLSEPGFGFALASSIKVDIPPERLKTDDFDLKETDADKQFSTIEEEDVPIKSAMNQPLKNSPVGFAFSSGKPVELSKEKMRKAMGIFGDDFNAGFSLSSGKSVDFTKDKLARAMNLFKDIDKDLEELEQSFKGENATDDKQAKKQLFPEFNEQVNEQFFAEKFSQEFKKVEKPFSGKSAGKLQAEVEHCEQFSFQKATNETKCDDESVLKHNAHKTIGERTIDAAAKNKTLENICADKSVPEMLQDAVTVYNSAIEKCSLPRITVTPDRKPPRKQLGMLGGPIKQINISKEGTERGNNLFKDMDLNLGNSPRREYTGPQCSTPKLKGFARGMESFNITPIKVTENCKKFKSMDLGDSTVLFHERSCADFKQLQRDIDKEYENYKRKLALLEERKNGLEQQKVLIEAGSPAHKRPTVGVLYDNKHKITERVPLKNLFNSGDASIDYFNIPQYIFDVTPKNAEDVHFNVASGNECLSVINTSDNAMVIPSSSNIVGVTEIDNAFRAMVGVDPKLLHHEWVQNHYRWIVWKLASYERKFPQYFKNCLSLENVMEQLKYRYDVEIDRAKRSALRRIFEKDDIPQKRMVLCVSDIAQQFGNKLELELSDGWYSIRTTIDQPLCQQIYKNKIKVGTKLMIQGAELLNCENGAHPLDAKDSVRLKINFNGTRRAHWYTKLGYYKFAVPYPIRMSSLSAEGGSVSFIKVYIARAYPLKYMEKLNNAKIWRNCKAEEKRAMEIESDRMKQIDLIKERACREYQNENHEQAYGTNNANITKAELSKLTCPKTLYNLIQRSVEPESLVELLTPLQQRSVMEYKHNLNNQKQHEISMKINKQIEELKVNKRDVTAVLKLLVMDAGESSEKFYTFSVWRPSEDHLQTLKEDTSFCVYNVTFGKMGELNSTQRTYFRPNNDALKIRKPERQLLPIAMTVDNYYKPLFGEFDTIGLIVQMLVENHQQELWLADFNGRLLYLKIANGPSICCLLDNFKKGQTIAISNLLKKASKSEFGIALANLCTVISQYPSQKYLQKGMQLFKEQLPKDLSKLLTDCDAKIEEYRKGANLSIVQNSFSTFNETEDSMEDNTTIPSRLTLTDVAMSLIDTDKFV